MERVREHDRVTRAVPAERDADVDGDSGYRLRESRDMDERPADADDAEVLELRGEWRCTLAADEVDPRCHLLV